MIHYPLRFFADAQRGKFSFAHCVEGAGNGWFYSFINCLPGGFFAILSEGIVPVTKHWREYHCAIAGPSSNYAPCLPCTIEIAVSSNNYLVRWVLAAGNARQRKEIDGRKGHHDSIASQKVYSECSGISFRYPESFRCFGSTFYQVKRILNLTTFKEAFSPICVD